MNFPTTFVDGHLAATFSLSAINDKENVMLESVARTPLRAAGAHG
jgi:hypothetical protein